MYTYNRKRTRSSSVTTSFFVGFGLIACILAVIGVASVAENATSAQSSSVHVLASYSGDGFMSTEQFQMQGSWKVIFVCKGESGSLQSFPFYLELQKMTPTGKVFLLKEWNIMSCEPGSQHTVSITQQPDPVFLRITCSHQWELKILAP